LGIKIYKQFVFVIVVKRLMVVVLGEQRCKQKN